MQTRVGIAMGVAAAVGMCVAACGAQPSSTKQNTSNKSVSVTVSYSGVDSSTLPAYVAQTGYTKKNGLNVNLEDLNSTAGTAALISGDVQIANIGGIDVLTADAAGAHLVIVANYDPVSNYELLVPPTVTKASQLIGKKIGISSPGSVSDSATLEALHYIGLTSSQVDIVAVGSHSARTAAALNGQISGEVDYPPGSIQVESHGWHPLVSLATKKLGSSGECIAVTRSYLKAHRGVVQRYVDAVIQAIGKIKADEALSVTVLDQYFATSNRAEMKQTWKALVPILPKYPVPTVGQMESDVRFATAKDPLLATFNVASALDPTLVQTAETQKVAG